MEIQVVKPERSGQICRFISAPKGPDSEAVYIIAEDPATSDNGESVYVVSLKDLQRNIKNPHNALRSLVIKTELAVISENLEEYIKGWNKW